MGKTVKLKIDETAPSDDSESSPQPKADPVARKLRAKVAAHRSWANTTDPAARTRNARVAAADRFEREVDPAGTLDPAERARRAASARKAYFLDLAARSRDARAARKVAA